MTGYSLSAGRHPAQIDKMKQLIAAGVCAFCPEHFAEYHDSPVEFKTKYWLVTKNDYPYDHTSLHLLIISNRHVRTISELTIAEKTDLLEAVAKVEERFNLKSYALGMRSGDFRFNGGSVDHLHGHIIVGDKSGDVVRMKLTSYPTS